MYTWDECVRTAMCRPPKPTCATCASSGASWSIACVIDCAVPGLVRTAVRVKPAASEAIDWPRSFSTSRGSSEGASSMMKTSPVVGVGDIASRLSM